MITYVDHISPADYAMLRASAGWRAVSPRQMEIGLRSSAFTIAAKDGERTVGMTRLISDGGYFAMVVDVVVLPEYRKQGIGREMMARATAYIQNNLRPGEQSYTILTSAPGKEEFYEHAGFHRVPTEDEGPGFVLRLAGEGV